MKRFYSALCSVCLFILSEFAFTQGKFVDNEVFDMSLEELLNVNVVTASKKLEGQWSAPSVMTVISKEEIELFGSRNLADVLEKVVGMQPYFNSVYGLSFLSVRGDTPSAIDARTLILVDGKPMFRNSISHSSNVIPYTLYPIESLQRIEVIRGPGSVLYGSGAFSSVINLITQKAKVSKASLSLGIGSFDTVDSTLDLIYTSNIWSFQSTTRFIDQDGDNFNAIGEDGLETRSHFYEDSNFLSHNKFTWLGLEVALIQSKSDRMTWFPSIKAKQRDSHRFENDLTTMNIGYTWEFSDNFRVEANTLYHRENLFNTFDTPSGDENSPVAENIGTAKDYIYEITAFGNHEGLGLSYVMGIVRDRSTGKDEADPGDPFSIPIFDPGNWDYWINSGYFQATYALNSELSFTAGAQYNDPDFSSGDFSPRFGLVGNYLTGFGFKLLYGEAFRAPVAGERLLTGDRISGNTELKNELIATTEFQLSRHDDNSEISVTFYRSRLTEIISTTPFSPASTKLQFNNQGKRTLQGIEIEGKLSFFDHWYMSANYSWQQNESNGVDGETLQPPWLLNIGIGKRGTNFHYGIYDTVVSRYGNVDRVNPSTLSVNPGSDTYHLVSASASWHFQNRALKGKQVDLNVSVHNLLNEEVNIPDFSTFTLNTIPGGPGRSILCSIRVGI